MTATVPAVPAIVPTDETAPTQEFFRYPLRHVVAVVGRPALATVLEGLVAAGAELAQVQVMAGTDGRRRLDATGTEQGLLARIQRGLVHALSSDSENVLTLMDNALRSGSVLVAVPLHPAGVPAHRSISAVLLAHGAMVTWTFRRWSVEVALG